MNESEKEMQYRPREVVRIVREWMLNRGAKWFSIGVTDEEITVKKGETNG